MSSAFRRAFLLCWPDTLCVHSLLYFVACLHTSVLINPNSLSISQNDSLLLTAFLHPRLLYRYSPTSKCFWTSSLPSSLSSHACSSPHTTLYSLPYHYGNAGGSSFSNQSTSWYPCYYHPHGSSTTDTASSTSLHAQGQSGAWYISLKVNPRPVLETKAQC